MKTETSLWNVDILEFKNLDTAESWLKSENFTRVKGSECLWSKNNIIAYTNTNFEGITTIEFEKRA